MVEHPVCIREMRVRFSLGPQLKNFGAGQVREMGVRFPHGPPDSTFAWSFFILL